MCVEVCGGCGCSVCRCLSSVCGDMLWSGDSVLNLTVYNMSNAMCQYTRCRRVILLTVCVEVCEGR